MTIHWANYRMASLVRSLKTGPTFHILRRVMTFFHINLSLAPRSIPHLRWHWCSAVVLAAIILFSAACGGDGEPKATDFQLTQFDGRDFRLSSQADECIVVLNFWYPTCPPCREEMPSFQAAWRSLQEQKEPVKFLGVFVPQGFDSEQDARDFVAQLGLTYPFATDLGARVAELFQVQVYPTTVFIDKAGRLFRTHISVLNEEQLLGIVREMSGGNS